MLRYVMGTIDYGIRFEKNSKLKLNGYKNSDWVGNVDDMKCILGYVFSLGLGVFSWSSKHQSTFKRMIPATPRSTRSLTAAYLSQPRTLIEPVTTAACPDGHSSPGRPTRTPQGLVSVSHFPQ